MHKFVFVFFASLLEAGDSPPRPGSASYLTPCDREMELHPGRYDSSIAAEFPPLRGGRPSVVSETLMRNIFCECVGPDRMTCSIVCTSQEMLNIVNMRLNPRAPWFRPFFVNSMISTNGRRLYRHPNAVPGVIAMILVYPPDNPPALIGFIEPLANLGRRPIRSSSPARPRSQSFPIYSRSTGVNLLYRSGTPPVRYHYPTKTIPMKLCTDSSKDISCPITHNDFAPGQVVYVLKSEVPRLEKEQAVCCISAEGLVGLNKRAQKENQEGFRDPLRRTGDDLLTLKDYEPFFISNDEEQSTDDETSQNGPHPDSEEAGSSADHAMDLSKLERNLPEVQISSKTEKQIFPAKTSILFLIIIVIFFVNICFTKNKDADTRIALL